MALISEYYISKKVVYTYVKRLEIIVLFPLNHDAISLKWNSFLRLLLYHLLRSIKDNEEINNPSYPSIKWT